MFNIFRKNKDENNPFELDWGQVTPEQFNQVKNEAVYVLNFDFSSEESRNYAMHFTIGRVFWYQKHLPNNCSHRITLDLRGQDEIKYELEIQDHWRNNTLKGIKNKFPQVDIEMSIII